MRTSTWCCCRPGVLVAIVLATCLLVSIRENNISEKTIRIIRTAMKNFRRYLTIARQQSSGFNSFDKTSSDNINTLNIYNCAKTKKNEHEIVNMAPLATLINARAKVAESFKLIIILAYMHTGSTYIGNLLSQHPGTFYQYEALRNLQMATMAAGRVRYLNGTVVWLKQCEHIDYQLAAEALGHMTSCRHERLDVLTLAANLQPLRKIFNKDVEAYFRCVDPIQRMGRRAQALFKRRKSPIEFIRTERIERCIPLLTNKCKQAKFRIWKFIRLTMNSAELFLKDYDDTSNVRIVHLVRDPRAMMDSQLRKNDLNVTVFSEFVSRTRYMCWRIMRDLKLLEDLKKMYPNVFYSLRYEDLVADPLKISRDLFRFIGMEFGNTDERYVRETSIDHRYNSTDRAVVWRRHIRQTHLDAVNDLCHEVYNNLGYVRLDDIDDVRDLNVKVHS